MEQCDLCRSIFQDTLFFVAYGYLGLNVLYNRCSTFSLTPSTQLTIKRPYHFPWVSISGPPLIFDSQMTPNTLNIRTTETCIHPVALPSCYKPSDDI